MTKVFVKRVNKQFLVDWITVCCERVSFSNKSRLSIFYTLITRSVIFFAVTAPIHWWSTRKKISIENASWGTDNSGMDPPLNLFYVKKKKIWVRPSFSSYENILFAYHFIEKWNIFGFMSHFYKSHFSTDI